MFQVLQSFSIDTDELADFGSPGTPCRHEAVSACPSEDLFLLF